MVRHISWFAIPLLAGALPLSAQEPAPELRPLTEQAARQVAAFYNRPTTTRVEGPTRVAEGATVQGDVASVGGPFAVAGVVAGDVVVINGDAVLLPGGRIEGSLIVVGGELTGDTASVAGGVVRYGDVLRFRRESGRLVALGPARQSWLRGWSTEFGRLDLILAAQESYNRVEGLPIAFGPRLELGRSNPTVVQAVAIYRTRNGFRIHPDDFGHRILVEQYLGGHRSMALGLSSYNLIEPIERRGLTDLENSLSTFVTHEDYRDHYGRRGWSAYLHFVGRTRPYEAGVEYRDEEQGTTEPGTPWALLGNDEDWRPEPEMAEGSLRSVRGWLQWDTRNDRADPSTGWLVRVEVEQGLEGELEYTTVDPRVVGPLPALEETPFGAEFTSVTIDARRYYRVGPRTRLALHALATGSPDDGALPPQRQHALGGEGSLPGYRQLQFDCGARAAGAMVEGHFPYYGCDRAVLLQAEMRFALFPGVALGRSLGLDFDLFTTPELVLFADAGRGWIEAESLGRRVATGPSDLRYDAGLGIRAGPVGFYLAVPLSGGNTGVNFFVRLGPRL